MPNVNRTVSIRGNDMEGIFGCEACAGTGVICANFIAKCDGQVWAERFCGCNYKGECPGDSKIICDKCLPPDATLSLFETKQPLEREK